MPLVVNRRRDDVVRLVLRAGADLRGLRLRTALLFRRVCEIGLPEIAESSGLPVSSQLLSAPLLYPLQRSVFHADYRVSC